MVIKELDLIRTITICIGIFLLASFIACPTKAQEMTGPRLVIEEKFFTHADVEQGATVEHLFKVRNSGNETLEIKKVVPG